MAEFKLCSIERGLLNKELDTQKDLSVIELHTQL